MDNRKTAGKIQLLLTLLVLVFLGLYISSISVFAGMYSYFPLVSGAALVAVLAVFILGGFYYVEMEKDEDVINIKYYNSFPFSREFKMYRIPVAAFLKYEIKGMPYFRRQLFMYQTSSNQVSKYPPIWVSSLSKKNIAEMASFLDKYVK